MKATFTYITRFAVALGALAILSAVRLTPPPAVSTTLSLNGVSQILVAGDGQETHGDKGNNPPKGKG